MMIVNEISQWIVLIWIVWSIKSIFYSLNLCLDSLNGLAEIVEIEQKKNIPMKVNIKYAYPILERDKSKPQHVHKYNVAGWEVQGTYLIDEKGCQCMTKPFDLNVRIEKIEVTNSELTEQLKKQLLE